MWLFRKLRQFYGDMHLRTKTMIGLILAVSLPTITMGIYFFTRLDTMAVSYTLTDTQKVSSQAIPQIGNILNQITEISDSLSKQPFYELLFRQGGESMSEKELADTLSAANFRKRAMSVVDGDLITGVRIYIDFSNDSPLFSSENTRDLFYPINHLSRAYWYGIFKDSSPSSFFCPSAYLGPEERENCGDLAYIRSADFYYRLENHDAYIVIYYSAQKLLDLLDTTVSLGDTASYLIDERNNVIAATDQSLTSAYGLDYDTLENSFTASNTLIERTIQEEKVYSSFNRISKTGWFLVTILPNAPLLAESNRMMQQFLLLYILALILVIAFSLFTTQSITGRISSVIRQMMNIRHGPPVLMESPRYHDEVGDLIDTYNYMVRRTNQLMENQQKAAEELRIAEFNSLQAQINPHFLYNTMDMINWQAQQGKTAEVSETVQKLSRFYRLTLSRKESISTIAQEEEHVTIYLQLQNMRFHDGITFVPDIPDELSECQIPKLTLQPVIENAVLHGILEKETKSGTIVLTGWTEDNDIILLVSDDGVGIPPEKLKTILAGAGPGSRGGTNIAVYNTHRRLQILYGEKYGLTYSSETGKGTEVQIRIPKIRNDL